MKRMIRKLISLISPQRLIGLIGPIGLTGLIVLQACTPEPPLLLYDAKETDMDIPLVDLDLQVYWDYELEFGIDYDWQAEWHYGWDAVDEELWGEIGYDIPTVFELRRYYTGLEPYAPHTAVIENEVYGTHFTERYDWGFWDILCWNQIHTIDGIRSLIFDEKSTLDSVTVFTNQTMHSSRYNAPYYAFSFHAPEPLFAVYQQGIDINERLEGFTYDAERNVYVKRLDMSLMPITYIYLTQVILHNNRGRVVEIDASSRLSGMARSATLNSGRAGSDAITVDYQVRMKRDCEYHNELVDIIGGRLLTFGICNLQANRVTRNEEVADHHPHYMEVNMLFNNGMDSTFVFDVTRQVRQRYKGGVLTVELDMDTIPIPQRGGGSGFDVVVKPVEDGGTHEFDMY